jgi:hypothetical protein
VAIKLANIVDKAIQAYMQAQEKRIGIVVNDITKRHHTDVWLN